LILLSTIGILVHPVYTFTYFVVGELLLLYAWASDEPRRKLAWIVLLTLNTFIVCSLFAYFEFMRGIDSGWTQDTMYADMQARADFDLGQNFYGYLNDWYFGTVNLQLSNTVKPFSSQPGQLLAVIIQMLPFDIVFIGTWIHGLKRKQNDKYRKSFFFCAIIAFIAAVPVFVLQIDYGRWCAGYYLSQGLLFLYLTFISDEDVTESSARIECWCRKHWVAAIVCLLYVSSLGVFKDIVTVDIIGKELEFFHTTISVIKAHIGI